MWFRRLYSLLTALGIAACSTAPEAVAPLSLSLTSGTSTVVVGETVSMVASANGSNLVGLAVDYGDETTDSYATAGANSARVTFRHAYATRGTFTARVTVTDGTANQRQATLEIHVN
ncbi:MAG: PKD domain-containing protein [Gemmatimonadaceae bacterium]